MTDHNDKIFASGLVVHKTLATNDDPTKQWEERDPYQIQGMCVHQSLEEYGTASGNAKYHSGPNHISQEGLPGLSYTGFIEKDGTIVLAWPVEKVTWSQGSASANTLYVGICVGGNFSGPGYVGTQEPTQAQLKSVRDLWSLFKDIWGWSDAQLFGHYHFGKKACPGYALQKLIENIRPQDLFSTTVERQKALSQLGYYKGAQDGIWGPVSKAALYRFEQDHGLDPDGLWDYRVSEMVKANLADW